MKPRKEIQWFAEKMEVKLKKNDFKPGWRGCSFDYLKRRVGDEVKEMVREATEIGSRVFWDRKVSEEMVEKFVNECADVANFMMMLADKARRLSQMELQDPPEEG